MSQVDLPKYPTNPGYMTAKIRSDYIGVAIKAGLLPPDAHRMGKIVTLTAPSDRQKPIQFWQLFSVLGQDHIVEIVLDFYQRVFLQEPWFLSVFERVGGINHHVNTQASMWIDVMGGGPYYHGAEFRLSFHHQHNALQLMTDEGAALWSSLMRETLAQKAHIWADDPRILVSLNTFLSYFMGKYADEFAFDGGVLFGETNGAYS